MPDLEEMKSEFSYFKENSFALKLDQLAQNTEQFMTS